MVLSIVFDQLNECPSPVKWVEPADTVINPGPKRTLDGPGRISGAGNKRVVGPAGLEPATKGFTCTRSFLNGADYLITFNRSDW